MITISYKKTLKMPKSMKCSYKLAFYTGFAILLPIDASKVRYILTKIKMTQVAYHMSLNDP